MTTRGSITGLLIGCALVVIPAACDAQRGRPTDDPIPRALENLRSSERARRSWGFQELLEMYRTGALNSRSAQGRAVLDSLLVIGITHSDSRGHGHVLGLAASINEASGSPPVIRADEWVDVYHAFEGNGAIRLLILGYMERHPSRTEALAAMGRMAVVSQSSPDEFTWAMDLLVAFEPGGIGELQRLQNSGGLTNPRARQALDARLRSIRPPR